MIISPTFRSLSPFPFIWFCVFVFAISIVEAAPKCNPSLKNDSKVNPKALDWRDPNWTKRLYELSLQGHSKTSNVKINLLVNQTAETDVRLQQQLEALSANSSIEVLMIDQIASLRLEPAALIENLAIKTEKNLAVNKVTFLLGSYGSLVRFMKVQAAQWKNFLQSFPLFFTEQLNRVIYLRSSGVDDSSKPEQQSTSLMETLFFQSSGQKSAVLYLNFQNPIQDSVESESEFGALSSRNAQSDSPGKPKSRSNSANFDSSGTIDKIESLISETPLPELRNEMRGSSKALPILINQLKSNAAKTKKDWTLLLSEAAILKLYESRMIALPLTAVRRLGIKDPRPPYNLNSEDKRINFVTVDQFQKWVLSFSVIDLRSQLLNKQNPLNDWFYLFRSTRDGTTTRPGWWVYFSDASLRHMYATQKISLPVEVLQQLNLSPRNLQLYKKVDSEKIRQFENWLFSTPFPQVQNELLSQTGQFKEWFSAFRYHHSGPPKNKRPGWWTYFSEPALRLIYETKKIYLPPEAIERLGVPSVKVPTGTGLRVDLEKVQKFQDWVLNTPLEQLRLRITSETDWFKKWFRGFRRTHNGQPKPMRPDSPGWWTFFSAEALHKIQATGVVPIPKGALGDIGP